MDNKQVPAPESMFDLLLELHVGLERQGPGSALMTMKAISFLDDLDNISRVADLGCGSGGQTMLLAQKINGSIVGLDLFADFINQFNENAKKHNLQNRVQGVVGSMENLPFENEEFDLIWSEGAIDNIGFEKGLTHWHGFLKKNGYVAVTCPSWLRAKRPDAIEKFWADAGSKLDTIDQNILMMQEAGYDMVAAFTLPKVCWTDCYFTPRQAAEKKLFEKYPDNEMMQAYSKENQYEEALFSKYQHYYGYVFYIGKKR